MEFINKTEKAYIEFWYDELMEVTDKDAEVKKQIIDLLYDIPYRYTLPMDANTLSHAREVRHETIVDLVDHPEPMPQPISVFEVLIHGANRCEWNYGDKKRMRFGYYRMNAFWNLVRNLKISTKAFDEGKIRRRIDYWLDRKGLDRYGRNTPFPLDHSVRTWQGLEPSMDTWWFWEQVNFYMQNVPKGWCS